jgi:hypothetical protein
MRITVLDGDPGRMINLRSERYRVFLNDVEVRRCLTADDEKGEVVVVVEDEHGHIVTEHGEVKRVTRHGRVRIQKKVV